MKSPFSKTRTAVVETKPELDLPAPYVPPIAPSVLVPSPPQSAPTQLDRIEAALGIMSTDVAAMKRRLGC